MTEAQTVDEKDIKVVEIDGKPVEYVEVDYPGKVEVGQIWKLSEMREAGQIWKHPGIKEVELVSKVGNLFIDSSETFVASGSYIELMGNFIGIAVEPVNNTTKEESMNKQAPAKITSISELNSISLKKPNEVLKGQKWKNVNGEVLTVDFVSIDKDLVFFTNESLADIELVLSDWEFYGMDKVHDNFYSGINTPLPTCIEKGQQWKNSKGEIFTTRYVITATNSVTSEIECFCWDNVSNQLKTLSDLCRDYSYLGLVNISDDVMYIGLKEPELKKPSKVEVGQRWLVDGEVKTLTGVFIRTGVGQVCYADEDYGSGLMHEYTASYILSCDYLGMKGADPLPETPDMVKAPNHYMLFPEHNLEAKHIVKRVTDNADKANFNMSSHEAAWVVQAMQYLLRFPGKNGWEDIKKAKEALTVAIEGYDERMEKEASKDS